MADLAAIEQQWLTTLPALRAGPALFGWEPYNLAEFARLLAVAVQAAPAGPFTDLGCGVGTKCVYAAGLGLTVAGVELVPEYAAQAAQLGVPVTAADLRTWDGYAALTGIVYLNCPVRDEADEAALEARIAAELPPGTVLIQVNDCGAPAGWDALLDERAQFRGVYRKPGG